MEHAVAEPTDSTHTYHELVDKSRPWYKNPRIVKLNLWILLLLVTSTANGFDGSMMNGLQELTQWEESFNYPDGSQLGLLSAIQNIGGLASLPFAPYTSDGIGRRYTVLLGSILIIIGAAIQTAAQSVGMFIGARFLLGFGLGFASNAAPMLVSEIAYPTQRAPLTSVYNSLWPFGALIAGWTTFGTFNIRTSSWAWRIPSAIQAAPSVFQAILMFWCPESPRWLYSRGRKEEALKTLAYYHGNGDAEDALVKFEYEEIKNALDAEKRLKRVGWSSLWKTSGNRKRMRIMIAIAFFSQWSGSGLVSYYLSKVFNTIGITDPETQLMINGFLNLWSCINAIGGGLLCERLGRRFLFITSTAGMFVMFLLQTVCSAQYALHGNKASGNAVVAFIFLYSAFYGIAYSPLLTSYAVEIMPYALRAKGLTVLGFAVSLSLIFNQYVNPIALAKLTWKYYIVYVVWLAFELVFVYIYVVETRGRTLEETAALFDGEDEAKKLTHGAATTVGLEEQSVGEKRSSNDDQESKESVTRDEYAAPNV